MHERQVHLTEILTLLVQAALVSDDEASLEYRQHAGERQRSLAAEPGGNALNLEAAWTRAVPEAERPELRESEGRVSLTLPVRCPVPIELLLNPAFDVDEVVNRIAAAAATG